MGFTLEEHKETNERIERIYKELVELNSRVSAAYADANEVRKIATEPVSWVRQLAQALERQMYQDLCSDDLKKELENLYKIGE